MLVQIPAHELDLLIAHLPVERFGGAPHTTGSEEDSLHAALPIQKREAGECISVVRFPDKDGKVAREKRFCATLGLEPVDYPPLGLQRKAQVREQCRGPGAGRANQPFRLVCSHRRLHPNTVPGGRGFPGDHRLFETQFGSEGGDRKSTRLNSSHTVISYAVFCLKKKKKNNTITLRVIKEEIATPSHA